MGVCVCGGLHKCSVRKRAAIENSASILAEKYSGNLLSLNCAEHRLYVIFDTKNIFVE